MSHDGDPMRLEVGADGGTRIAGHASSDRARAAGLAPRLLDREAAAAYLSVSVDTVDRLLQSGALHVVRLPVQRDPKTGLGVRGTTRRILVDRHELDSLVEQSREAPL
jgi:hypothetical protein